MALEASTHPNPNPNCNSNASQAIYHLSLFACMLPAVRVLMQACPLADKVVFYKVKDKLGGRVRLMISGGAPLARHVEDFLKVKALAYYLPSPSWAVLHSRWAFHVLSDMQKLLPTTSSWDCSLLRGTRHSAGGHVHARRAGLRPFRDLWQLLRRPASSGALCPAACWLSRVCIGLVFPLLPVL